MKTRELRFTARPQVRSEGAGRFISGYAAVFNTIADINGMFLERVAPGAFARAIREKQDTRCLINHDVSLILGRVSNGTLTPKEDSKGLSFRCDVARTGAGDDALSLVRRDDVGECSFGFIAVKEEWSRATDGSGLQRDLRTLLDVDLFDVSAVTFPAYDATSVAVDENSRMVVMFPAGAPASAPLELRSRITAAVQISDAEYLDRLRARKQAERLMVGLDDSGDRERLARLARIRESL